MTPEVQRVAAIPAPRLSAGARRDPTPAPTASAQVPAPAPAPQPQQVAAVLAEQAQRVAEAAAAANRELAKKGSELTIEFEDALNRMVFRLVDKETGDVVRQIPSEEVLAVARALAEDGKSGVLVSVDA